MNDILLTIILVVIAVLLLYNANKISDFLIKNITKNSVILKVILQYIVNGFQLLLEILGFVFILIMLFVIGINFQIIGYNTYRRFIVLAVIISLMDIEIKLIVYIRERLEEFRK